MADPFSILSASYKAAGAAVHVPLKRMGSTGTYLVCSERPLGSLVTGG